MKHRLFAARKLDEPRAPLIVKRTVRRQKPEHNSIRSKLQQMPGVKAHRIKIVLAVIKTSHARPDDRHNRNVNSALGHCYFPS